MNIPPLRIHQTSGKIAIQQNHGGAHIQQPPAEMRITTEQPPARIQRTSSELAIDQSRAFETYGLISPLEITPNIVQTAKQKVLEYVARTAREGKRMADFHRSGNVFAEVASEYPPKQPPIHFYSRGTRLGVDYTYTPERIDIDAPRWQAHVDVQPHPAVIERIPAEVHVGMQQHPHIDIQWTGSHVDIIG